MLEENTSCWIQEPRRGKAAVASQPRVQPEARLKAHSPDMHTEHIHTTNVGIPAANPTAHKQPSPKQSATMRSTHPASLCLSRLEFTGVSIYIYKHGYCGDPSGSRTHTQSAPWIPVSPVA